MKYSIIKIAALSTFMGISSLAFAQSNTSVDPACIIKNTDGSQNIDKVKCPDGMTVGAASSANPVTPDTTASTTPMDKSIIVPAESFNGAKVISANDFIGKRVYTKAGEDVGEVNDLILTDNGSIQAVVLGVGGFLGIGEKDVAITMASIDMAPEGSSIRLVVDSTKEQLTAAPAYNRVTRTYIN